MANSSALATVKEIVDGIIFKAELPEGRGAVVDQIVRDGYRKLNTKVLDEGRVIGLFTMDSNLIIPFPSDCIKINDIFVPRNNEVWSLTRRTSIPKITTIESGATVIPDDWGAGADIPHGEGTYFETSGGRNDRGYFEIDEPNRRILFRNVDRSEVMLDYNSSGIDNTNETYIPIHAKEALENYVLRELSAFGIISGKMYSIYDSRYEKELAELRMIDFNWTHFTDAVYETFNSSIYR